MYDGVVRVEIDTGICTMCTNGYPPAQTSLFDMEKCGLSNGLITGWKNTNVRAQLLASCIKSTRYLGEHAT